MTLLSLPFFARLRRFSNAKADASVRAVSKGVNGPMLAAIAKKIEYHDSACVDLLRRGGPLLGMLEQTGPCRHVQQCVIHFHALRFFQEMDRRCRSTWTSICLWEPLVVRASAPSREAR